MSACRPPKTLTAPRRFLPVTGGGACMAVTLSERPPTTSPTSWPSAARASASPRRAHQRLLGHGLQARVCRCANPEDIEFEQHGVKVLIDPKSLPIPRRHRAGLRARGPQRRLQVQQPERQGRLRLRREFQRLRRYLEMQSRVHPDRFASSERRRAAAFACSGRHGSMKATRRSKSHWRGRDTCCIWQGRTSAARTARLMPVDFLVEQMEWREAVAESRAAGDHHELERLHHRLKRDMLERYEEARGAA
jgi:hypothetical protein